MGTWLTEVCRRSQKETYLVSTAKLGRGTGAGSLGKGGRKGGHRAIAAANIGIGLCRRSADNGISDVHIIPRWRIKMGMVNSYVSGNGDWSCSHNSIVVVP